MGTKLLLFKGLTNQRARHLDGLNCCELRESWAEGLA